MNKLFLKINSIAQYAYIFNSFSITFLFILLIFFGHNEEAISIIYFSSIPMFITQMLSINARNVGIADNDINSLNKNISMRIILSPIIILLSLLFYHFIFKEELSSLEIKCWMLVSKVN